MAEKTRLSEKRSPSLESRTDKATMLRPENPGEDFFTAEQWIEIGTALDLSLRELSVTIAIFEGRTRKEIARKLLKTDGKPLSPETVRVYTDRVFGKLRVQNRVGLVLRMIRVQRQLSEPDERLNFVGPQTCDTDLVTRTVSVRSITCSKWASHAVPPERQ